MTLTYHKGADEMMEAWEAIAIVEGKLIVPCWGNIG